MELIIYCGGGGTFGELLEFSGLFLLKYYLPVSKEITAGGVEWHLTSSGIGKKGGIVSLFSCLIYSLLP